MPAVVALSDLHLGEDSSTLNPLLREVVPPVLRDREEFKHPPLNTMPHKLNALLKRVARQYGGISDLVLVGDIMDLSLAPYAGCALQAREFFQQLLAGILPGAVVWVPGNHDHHLWVQACEEEYIEMPLRSGQLPREFPRITGPGRDTGAWSGYGGGAQFLLGLFPPHVRKRCWLAYPNYVTVCGEDHLLFHHGHFFDQKISWIGTSLAEARSLAELEMFNAPYLDFIWYGSGQSGSLSEQLENIYEELRWLAERLGMVLDILTLKWLFKRLLGQFKKGGDRGSELDPALAGRMARYLAYIDREREAVPGSYPARFSLVFGHTHRPLAGEEVRGCPVYNPGGWTADEIWPGRDNLRSAVFVAAPELGCTVQRVEIDREIYDFCHRLNHAIREAVHAYIGVPG